MHLKNVLNITVLIFIFFTQLQSQSIEQIARYDFSQAGAPEDRLEIITATVNTGAFIYTAGIADLTIDNISYTVPWLTKSDLLGNIISAVPLSYSIEAVEDMFVNDDDNLIIHGEGNRSFIAEIDQSFNVIQFVYLNEWIRDLVQRQDGKYVGVNIDRLIVYNQDLSIDKEIFIPEKVGPGGVSYHRIISKADSYVLTGTFTGCPFENFPDLISSGGLDFIILEINESGEVLWVNSLEGSQNKDESINQNGEIGYKDVFITSEDDTYLITVRSSSSEGDFSDGLSTIGSWIFKLDQTGDVIWKSSVVDFITDLKQVNGGELVFTTRALSTGNSLVECDTCKSNLAWLGVLDFNTGAMKRQTYLDAERNEFFTAFETGNNNVILYGETDSHLGTGIFYDDFFAADKEDLIIGRYNIDTSNTELFDNDNDGYLSDLDCDDTNPDINPGQDEIVYNGIDDDCDSQTLDDDLDGDGFLIAEDCDDTNSDINPNQAEIVYNGIDDDCNSQTLDDDLDEDGYLVADDCDDTDSSINPGAIEIPDNGIDEDCDGEDNLDNPCNHPDYNSLIEFYTSTGGNNWIANNGWEAGVIGDNCDVCNWEGVICNSQSRVRMLDLSSNNLSGEIPNSIAEMIFLNRLYLDNNQLTGPIPNTLCDLELLIQIRFSNNQLTGQAPECMAQLSNLVDLELDNNSLSGNINFISEENSELREINLNNNLFSGQFPNVFSNLSQLWNLNLSNNQLSGELPNDIGINTALNYIILGNNNLSGNIPSSLIREHIFELDLSKNNFEGCIEENAVEGLVGNYNYLFYENPLLPWQGQDLFIKIKNGEQQIGAPCQQDSNTLGRISEACECVIVSSIESEDINNLQVYPIPTRDIIFLSNISKTLSYQVIDLSGRVVKEGESTEAQIDLSGLISGLYLLRIEGREPIKIVKI